MDSILSMFVAPVVVSMIGLGVEYFVIRHRLFGSPSVGIRVMLFIVPFIGLGFAFAIFSWNFWMVR